MSLRAATMVVAPGPARRLDRALRELCPEASWGAIRSAIAGGKVSVAGRIVSDAGALVEADQALRIDLARPGARPPCELAPEAIVFIDSQLVVVRKPAGISTVPHESDPAPSLLELLSARLRPHGRGPPRLHVVQRLDRETSGLLVLARTPAARELLKGQFRRRTVIRSYLALAAGELASSTFRSRLVRDRGDGRRGSTRNPKLGRLAVTHVELLERFAGASLVRCRLETGRTHQIRIQLSEAGHPLLGERAYRRRSDPDPPLPVGRLMLHAATLGFAHPLDARPMRFEEPMPPDMRSLCERLRAAAPPAGRDRGGLTALHRST